VCIAAAIIGGAIIGAAGVAIAGGEAASATKDAAASARQSQLDALAQQKQLAAPYTGLGQDAIAKYEALLGITPQGKGGPGQGPAPRPGTFPGGASIQETLASMPGYQFAKQQGLDATKAQAGAMGMGLSGNTLEELDKFSTGLADQTYNQELQNLLAPIQIGQGAAAGQAANIGAGAANLSNIAIGQGNNLAGIYANEAAGITKAIGNAGNQYLTYQTLQNLQGGGGSPVSGDYFSGSSGGLMPAGGGYTYNDPGYIPGG